MAVPGSSLIHLNASGCRMRIIASIHSIHRKTGIRAQQQTGQPSSTISARNTDRKKPENVLVVSAVTVATEILRYLNNSGAMFNNAFGEIAETKNKTKAWQPPPPPESIDDALEMLKSDFTERAYFVTGVISQNMYSPDCLFIDPTISFRGTDLYIQNLSLLVPFLISPSIDLLSLSVTQPADMENGVHGIIRAEWILRTGVSLPWTPFVELKGATEYELTPTLPPLIIRHEEMWSISGYEALKMIFTPSKINDVMMKS